MAVIASALAFPGDCEFSAVSAAAGEVWEGFHGHLPDPNPRRVETLRAPNRHQRLGLNLVVALPGGCFTILSPAGGTVSGTVPVFHAITAISGTAKSSFVLPRFVERLGEERVGANSRVRASRFEIWK